MTETLLPYITKYSDCLLLLPNAYSEMMRDKATRKHHMDEDVWRETCLKSRITVAKKAFQDKQTLS